MNGSASKSSLASSSGKPSTANSSSSPNGRKTRTIIVARTVPDEPMKIVPAASRGEARTNGTPDVVNQQHSRDTRSGKLSSYAALGEADDVERFDKFLADQRGQPSASELRAAATSPQHMLASMKRKTMSRIQLDINDGKSTETGTTTEDASTRKFMQHELENDAQKRREEAVAHRKWLNSLPIHERVAQQRQQNVLRKWRQMNRDWATFKVRAARRLGKAPQELVMSRAAVYREQREMYDALQKAQPLSDKVGGDIWLVSLRNEGTRFVPVGNIFSGLFCPIRESPKLGPRVRRPLDYHDNQEEREHETSRPLSKLEKRSLNLLARKKWRLRKQLEVLQPHEVDPSTSSHLAVGTVDLFAWASGELEESIVEDESTSIRAYSANVDEASRRSRLRSYTSPSSSKSVTKGEIGNPISGPTLRVSYGSDELDPISEGINLLSGNFPESCLPPLRLSFYTPIGELDQRSLSVFNDGNTIVHYQWWRAPFEDDSLTAHLRGHRTRRDEQELESCTKISVSKLGGTLLPGDTEHFVFTFESSKAGVFLEKWLLDAEPRPRIHFGATSINDDNLDPSVVDLPIEVRLSCVAEDKFAAGRRRQMQLTRMGQHESHFFVANLVDEILDGVRPPEAVAFSELTPLADVARFYDQNGSSKFCDAYFSTYLLHACFALYQRAQDIIRALSPALYSSVEEDNHNEENGVSSEITDAEKFSNVPPVASPEHNSDNEEAEEEVPFPAHAAHLVEAWDWRLETLRELCKMADEAQNAKCGYLTKQLRKEIEEVEEDNENEEEEGEEEDDGEDDGEDDDDGGGSENVEVPVVKVQRVNPREIRRIERLARRKAIEDELSALKPNLVETFDTLRFSACTAPYSTKRLHERLHEKIGSLCSETPVVCEIAKVTNNNHASNAQVAKVEGVGKLLMRAIDEAIGGDQDHQALFEQERRRIQGMWLGDKASYLSIGQRMARHLTATIQPSLPLPTNPGSADGPSSILNSAGVLLMQLDLDLASWFSLVKVENRGASGSGDGDGVLSTIDLTWCFSPDLIQHTSFVPSKIYDAAESLTKVLNALSTVNPAAHTIVLVSELSRPPLTRKMCKLLHSASQAEIKAGSASSPTEDPDTEEKETREIDHRDDEESVMVKSLLERLSPQLSLRSVAPILQRATQKDVVFCSTLEEVEAQIELSRKELQLSSSVSLGGIESPLKESEVGTVDQQGGGLAPKVVLLEHIDAAGKDLITQASRKRELASSKPATTAQPEPQKSAGAGKKPSNAAPTKGKPGTPVTSVAPVPVPPVETPLSSVYNLTNLDFSGKDLAQQGTLALCSQISRMVSVCILDGIPSQVFESIFAFDTLGVKHIDVDYPPLLAGPTLYQEIETWSHTLQPPLSLKSRCCPFRAVTAIVGGKCLETKLRLIDSLLEFVHEIYFVGEVAMSLYRVLHTQHSAKPSICRDNSMKHDEEEEELEDDTEVATVRGGDSERIEGFHEGILEEETIELGNDNDACGHFVLNSTRTKSMWDLLRPAVEKLQQKASRKCVRLMLPVDWIVGETPLEEQDLNAAATAEVEDDDDDDEEDAEETEEEEERGKKTRKRRGSEMKTARQKLLVEPDDADMFDLTRQGMYEGERSHVLINHGLSRSSDAGWLSFQDVTSQCLSSAHVVEGKASVLAPLASESDGDDGDEEGDDRGLHNSSPPMFEHEWTFRAMDVGPIAMDALQSRLTRQGGSSAESAAPSICPSDESVTPSRALIVNGVCGAVEFHEFCAATNQLLGILRSFERSDVFIAGNSTANWLRQLEIMQLNTPNGQGKSESINSENATNPPVPRKVVDARSMRNARVIKQLLAAKPHPILANLV